MNYYPELDSNTRDKVRVLDLSNYATKKELNNTTVVDTSSLAVKRNFVALKAEVDKLDVPADLNNLKTKVYDLNVVKLETVPVDLKKLSDVVSKEVVKNTAHRKLNREVNNLENKIPDGTTLIHINQCKPDIENLEKKIGEVEKKIPDASVLVTATVRNTKIGEVEIKIPEVSGLVKKRIIKLKHQIWWQNISLLFIIISLQVKHLKRKLKKKDLLNKSSVSNLVFKF